MYDRLTNTLWSQLLGEPIVGRLVGSGITLDYFPTALTTWGEWRAEHPHTTVLSRETGYYAPRRYEREDDSRSMYYDYRSDTDTMFPIWNRDRRLAPKSEVLGVAVNGAFKAYPLGDLRRERVVHDAVNGVDLVIAASATSSDALVFRSGGMRFTLPDDAPESLPDTLLDAGGAVWQVERSGMRRADDMAQTLPLHPANVSFWFGWYITHPDTLLYDAAGR